MMAPRVGSEVLVEKKFLKSEFVVFVVLNGEGRVTFSACGAGDIHLILSRVSLIKNINNFMITMDNSILCVVAAIFTRL